MDLTVVVHQDGAEYWAEVADLAGCFAAGRTLSELHDALAEAVGLYLWDIPAEIEPAELTVGAVEIKARPCSPPSPAP